MDPIMPKWPTSQPADATRPSTGRSPGPWRPIVGGVSTLAIAAMLLVALSGFSRTSTLDLGANGQASRVGRALSDQSPTLKLPRPTPSVHEVAQTTVLSGTSTGPATAACPTGQYAIGGGWSVPQGSRIISAMVTGNTWTVYTTHPQVQRKSAVGPAILGPSISVTAYVECLSGVSTAVVTQRGYTTSIPPSPTPDVLNSPCTAEEVPMGFGIDLSASGALEFAGAYPFILLGEAYEWSYHVMNHDTVAHPVSIYVECLSDVTISRYPFFGGSYNVYVFPDYVQADGGPVPAGTSGSLQALCPAGEVVAGGGFDYLSGGSGDLYQLHTTANGWQGTVYASAGGTGLSLLAEAICLTFSY